MTNGIILRSDLHDLFDLNLIGIDENYKIIISPQLVETEYEAFNGKQISLPNDKNYYPSTEALRTRPILFKVNE